MSPVSDVTGAGKMRRESARVIDNESARLTGNLYERVGDVLATDPVAAEAGAPIGTSREGQEIRAFRFGSGPFRVSLLGGCHADEPVGPALLRRLCAYLGALDADDALVERYEWWIIPHVNPDGALRNRSWQDREAEAYDLASYLTGVVRELPGDDVEFGFPVGTDDGGARSENRAALDWWREAGGPFHLHVSVHGMAFSAGPWFLIDADWIDRTVDLRVRCAEMAQRFGYRLHDVDRGGEKGFVRITPGFCTRPSSGAMRQHFRALGDQETAARFRPSSMETIRSLGGDPLTLVTEMPLFITPGVGEELGPPDPAAARWKERVEGWKLALARSEASATRVSRDADELGLRAMPIEHQMILQWALIAAGLEAVSKEPMGESPPAGASRPERMSGR